MARRSNALANLRNARNQPMQRFNARNRTRNNNPQPPANAAGRRSVRRVFKNRNFKGAAGALNKRGGPKSQANAKAGAQQNAGAGRRRRNFTYRRFNRSFRSKRNFKRNKDAKTADEMVRQANAQDMELDEYMGGEATKARLDADLTKYFAQNDATA